MMKNCTKAAVCVPLPNPRNVQKAVKNNIIGDSYYSEEDDSDAMSSFADSSDSDDQEIDRSEDQSRHSSKERVKPAPSRMVRKMREKRRNGAGGK